MAQTAENVVVGLIKQADGLQKIEQLQENPNEEVDHKAMRILERYFPHVDEAHANEGSNFIQSHDPDNADEAHANEGLNFLQSSDADNVEKAHVSDGQCQWSARQ